MNGSVEHQLLSGGWVIYYAYWDYRSVPPRLVVPDIVAQDIAERATRLAAAHERVAAKFPETLKRLAKND